MQLKCNPELAKGFRANNVRNLLKRKQKEELLVFLRRRYKERFFDPIRVLQRISSDERRFGFAIMALGCLLVETIESFRLGLPSTGTQGRELTELKALSNSASTPQSYKIGDKEWKSGLDAFKAFFSTPIGLFPELDGEEFYRSIRNGLLHQGQTKKCWTVRKKDKREAKRICDPNRRIIYRDAFADALERAFESYLSELKSDGELWQKAERKIWWLIETSL